METKNKKMDANKVQWKRTSLTLFAEDAKVCKKHQDAFAYETYLLIEKKDDRWYNTGIRKEVKTKFSWLDMTREIAKELAQFGIYQRFEDVVRVLPDGRTLPGTGKTLLVDEEEYKKLIGE